MPRIVHIVRLPAFAGVLSLTFAVSLSTVPVFAEENTPPGGYPSWQDVEVAKKSEAGKAAEVTKITDLLDGLQERAEALGGTAVTSAAEYELTAAALRAATVRVEDLTAQTARAGSQLGQHKREIGALAAQSYKTGGTNMGFFVALDAVQTNSIQGLNIVRIVGHKTAALVAGAAAAERVSRALADQEKAARAERERLSGEAKTKLDAAQAAQQAMSRQIAEQQERGRELTAQLASLKGTTAAVEGEFLQGQAAIAAYEAAQTAKRAAAAEQERRQAEAAARAAAPAAAQKQVTPAPTAPPAAPVAAAPPPAPAPAPAPVPAPAPAPVPAPAPSPPPVVAPSVPGGAVNDPAAAKSYASGRLTGYGWGQDQFPCLAQLWTKESNWLTTATNPYSGAYGIAQALPPGKYATAGSDWLTSYRTQVEWGLGYIADRYGSPCAAWNHSVIKNWY